ncbi:MAG: histidine ammonia-lyase, partial [Bacillota bacterium]|nr:histidine ammonia-lyase [Bacillota bacterium]
MNKIIIDGKSLTIEKVVDIARFGAEIELSNQAIEDVKESRKIVDRFVKNKDTVYGITTGFGKFADVTISEEDTAQLQENLIMSHACGVGNPLSKEIVKAIMVLRINNLSKGYSGIRLSTLNVLVDMVNKGVYPIVPEKGSLGASGDLAPLAHLVLVMIGKGEAIYNDVRMSGKEAMDKAGIEIAVLSSKEGLALINGTQVMTAVGVITLYDAKMIMSLADISAALTVEGLKGITDAYDKRLHIVRPHAGQINTASNLLRILEGSKLTTKQGELRVQDAYSLRCIPQIHGASKDSVSYIESKVNIEINSVTDNPIIFKETNEAISGGNFHGQPMALVFDFLKIALAEIANSCERRIERLVNPQLSGLPAFLTKKGGLNSGFMIAQYSAASLVSENKVLAHPASVDSIPSSANQEDHVSMGTIAARQAKEILGNVEHVLSIELLAACQAIDFDDNLKLGVGTRVAYDLVRREVTTLHEDRVMHLDMDKVFELIISHE